jgi:hypothetical protein
VGCFTWNRRGHALCVGVEELKGPCLVCVGVWGASLGIEGVMPCVWGVLHLESKGQCLEGAGWGSTVSMPDVVDRSCFRWEDLK